MRAFIVSADDRPGMVASVTKAAADAGVNLRGLAGIANGTTGLLALIGDNDDKLRAALAAGGRTVREAEVVMTTGEDRVGGAAELTARLAEAGVNLELLLPMGMGSGGRIDVAVAATDIAALRRALGQA
jgi:hypothetical protein